MRRSSALLPLYRTTLVAVFVGGTSGIGETAAKALAQSIDRPNIYFIGRNEGAGARILEELKMLGPGGSYHFIKAGLTRMWIESH
jgi:NAD(P)-dependent dehydrogenase (short-subunit alcohol dehydrogenase family)